MNFPELVILFPCLLYDTLTTKPGTRSKESLQANVCMCSLHLEAPC